VEENQTPSTADTEDVEGHGLVDRPPNEQPSVDANTEEADFEGHTLVERPPVDRPVVD